MSNLSPQEKIASFSATAKLVLESSPDTIASLPMISQTLGEISQFLRHFILLLLMSEQTTFGNQGCACIINAAGQLAAAATLVQQASDAGGRIVSPFNPPPTQGRA